MSHEPGHATRWAQVAADGTVNVVRWDGHRSYTPPAGSTMIDLSLPQYEGLAVSDGWTYDAATDTFNPPAEG